MFERYNEEARKAIFFARAEAGRLGIRSIEPEHLLVGIVLIDERLRDFVLSSGITLPQLHSRLWPGPPLEAYAQSVDVPFSNAAKRVLAYGAEEAEQLKSLKIGAGHLLLGLLREEPSAAGAFLKEQGLTLDSLRRRVGDPGASSDNG